jgi:hypothetical protein
MRRLAGLPAASLAGLLITVAGCDPPVPPPVAVREPAIDADDLAVMKGLLDDRLRPKRNASGAAAGARFLVVDSTIASCDRRIEVFGPPPGGCLTSGWIDFVLRVMPLATRRTAMLDFEARNIRRLTIEGTLGDDVAFVSSTASDFLSAGELLRRHPPGSRIVTFSAPSYPAPNVAVLAYGVRTQEIGAVRLEQAADRRWKVAPQGWSGRVH